MFDFQLGKCIDIDVARVFVLFMSISKFTHRSAEWNSIFPDNKTTYVCMILIYIDYIRLIS